MNWETIFKIRDYHCRISFLTAWAVLWSTRFSKPHSKGRGLDWQTPLNTKGNRSVTLSLEVQDISELYKYIYGMYQNLWRGYLQFREDGLF